MNLDEALAVLNNPESLDNEIGLALTELTNSDASLFMPSPKNNLRIAVGRSFSYELEHLVRIGFLPGAELVFNGEPAVLLRYHIETGARHGLMAELRTDKWGTRLVPSFDLEKYATRER